MDSHSSNPNAEVPNLFDLLAQFSQYKVARVPFKY